MNNSELTYEKFIEKFAKTKVVFKEMHQHHAVYENKEEGIRIKFEVKYNDFIKNEETVESCSWKSNVSWNPNI